MAKKDNIAYTITTGYYPEIAAEVGKQMKTGKGTGRIMQRSFKARGFTPASIQRQEMLKKKDAMIAAGASEADILGLKGKYGVTMFAKGKQHRDSYKFIGGDERYKLYGDQVWYMEGKRARKDMISDYLDEYKMNGPQFQHAYSRAEGEMVSYAKELAEKVFDQSWDVALLEKHIAEGGEDVAEEMGFTVGDFEYMSVEAAIKDGHKLQVSKSSAANNRDMVKVNKKTGQIEASFDVTEQVITQTGQHGITETLPKDLIEVIKDLNPKNKGQMEKLRQGVIKMFVKQIDKDYNPMIKYFKKSLIKPQGQHNVKWDTILKKILEKDKKTKKASVKDLARNIPSSSNMPYSQWMDPNVGIIEKPLEIEQFHMLDTGDKVRQQTSVEYIAHMLGSLTKEVNENFQQAHKVKEMDGENVYAIVPMKTHMGGPEHLLFDRAAPDKAALVTGFNATLALEKKALLLAGESVSEIYRKQANAFMTAKMSNDNNTALGPATSGVLNNLASQALRPSTAIMLPAPKDIHAFLVSMLEGAVPDKKKIKKMQSRLYGNVLGMDKREKFKRQNHDTMFWALPYIGVMQSERAEKINK